MTTSLPGQKAALVLHRSPTELSASVILFQKCQISVSKQIELCLYQTMFFFMVNVLITLYIFQGGIFLTSQPYLVFCIYFVGTFSE